LLIWWVYCAVSELGLAGGKHPGSVESCGRVCHSHARSSSSTSLCKVILPCTSSPCPTKRASPKPRQIVLPSGSFLADFGGSDQQKAPGAGFLVFPSTVCRVRCRKPDFGGYPFFILLFLRFQKTEKHNFWLLYFFWSPFNLEQNYHIPLPRKLVDFI